jgi:hypothetical protein
MMPALHQLKMGYAPTVGEQYSCVFSWQRMSKILPIEAKPIEAKPIEAK